MSLNYKPIDTDFRSYYPTADDIKKAFKPLELYTQSLTKQIMNSNYGLRVNVAELSATQRELIKDIYRNGKTHFVSDYGVMIKENKDMRIKDFIVLHADGQPVMVKKEAISVLSKMSDGTTRVDTGNQIWITDDKYEDVIKRLFEV